MAVWQRQGRRLGTAVATCSLLAILLVATSSGGAHAASGALARAAPGVGSDRTATFTNFELGPFNQPGLVCPNPSNDCINFNAEPQIASSPAGAFYASSEYLPPTTTCGGDASLANPDCGGTGAWASSDGGAHYVSLPSPNSASVGGLTLSAWGGDTDIATASQPNANGDYNVYVLSLERAAGPLLNVAVSTSTNGGQTWTVNPTSAAVPADDRPWIAAGGASEVCLSYFAEGLGQNVVGCSDNAGLTFSNVSETLDSNHAWLTLEDGEGNIAIDPNNGVIYVVFPGLLDQEEALQCALTCSIGEHALWVAVSTDGGASFTDHLVYSFQDSGVTIGHQFPVVAVDALGNVYAAFSDNHNIYLSTSQDFGSTWSGAAQVNSLPAAATSVEPWIAAGSPGQVDVVWYGTSYYNASLAPDNYPYSTAWYVFFAQSFNALASAPSFSQTTTGEVVHHGGVCEGGIACTGNQTANRDLFDDFGVAASPTTGLASIVYSDDQYVGSANEPASAFCTPSQTNTGNCTRTNIATQISGTGIVGRHHGVDVRRPQLGVGPGGHPTYQMELTDTSGASLTGLTVALGGVTIGAVGYSPALPLMPGGASWGVATLGLSSGLVPTVAGVYGVTVTALFSDGSTATESFNVIYTLLPVATLPG